MSKRPDEDGDMEAGMTTAERRRRRRRGAGLRVPSDNVPRRAAPTPPVPEDPNLAVSIAYSFTAQDASGPVERRDTDELDRPDTLGDGPDDPVAPEAQATAVDPEDEDGAFAAKTREMTAVDLEALGLSDPSPDGERRVSGQRASVGPATRLSGPNLRLPTPDPMRARTDPQLRAPTDPRVDSGSSIIVDDDLETSITTPPRPPINQVPVAPAAATTMPGAPVAPTRPPPTIPPLTPPGATSASGIKPMPVAVPTPSLSVKFRTPQPTPGPTVPATIPPPKATPVPATPAPRAPSPGGSDDEIWEVKSAEIDVEDLRSGSAPEDAPTVMRPVVDPAAGAPAPELPKKARASTMALADEDLEELGADVKAARGKLFAQSGETVALTDGDLEDVGKSGKLAKATKEESGEIVVDVMEEVDSGDIAKPVPPVAASPVTPNRRTPSGPIPMNGGTSAPGHRPPPVPHGHAPGTTLPPPAPAAKHGADASHPPPPPSAKSPPPAPAAKKPTVVSAAAAAAAAKPADPSKRAKRGKPWFEEIFDEDYLRTLPFLTPQATQAEAQFVIDVLSIQPGAQLLDLGCGYGRHAMELAARGFHLVGLDLSLPLLLRGADEAQRRGLSINFVHADMRELDFDAQFDGVYCLFSTFGYFDDETNKKTANAVARALKPGGRFVIEVLNRDYVIGELPTRVWWEGDGCVVLEEVEFNYFSSRIHSNRSVVFDDGRQIEQEISVRAYSLHELGKLLHSAGFRVVEVSGSVHTRGRYFGNQSRHIIVVAEKKPKESAGELPAK
jgi:SAM-dependent methyltransferase